MRAKSEITKSSTPLRRIPKNRGTVVRKASETNPLSEKEIKNVIAVYSEANKAYYKNYAKNESNKKKRKKKTVYKKTESAEFDLLSLNPLNYRNHNFEENGTLLHLPGYSVTPNYTIQNPNAQYAVSSMTYGTLHKSNPLSWGCEYKKHYELPTICSIVKSKHPIYSKPNNEKTREKFSKCNSKTKGVEKYNTKFVEKKKENSKNMTNKKVPTFGNLKEYQLSDCTKNKDKISEHAYERYYNIETTLKDDDDSDKTKDISDNTYNYSDFFDHSKNSSNKSKLKIETNNGLPGNTNDYNFTLKREDDVAENENNFSNIQNEEQNYMHPNKELNVVNPKNKNGITNMYSNHSVGSTSSNWTLPEFKASDTLSKNEYSQDREYSCSVSEYSNYSHNNGNDDDKSESNNLCDNTMAQGKTEHGIYNKDEGKRKEKGKREKNPLNAATAKEHELHIKKGKTSELSLLRKISCEPFERVPKENSKKQTIPVKFKMHPTTEGNKRRNNPSETSRKQDCKKYKQKKQFRKNNSQKSGLVDDLILSNGFFYNKNKKKNKIKCSKRGYCPKKNNEESDNTVNNKSHNARITSKIGSKVNTPSDKHNNIPHVRILESKYKNDENFYNFAASKQNMQEYLKVGQNNLYKMGNLPNEQFYVRNEITNLTNKSIPINNVQVISGKETYTRETPVYAYSVQGRTHKTPSIIHRTFTNIPQTQQINISQSNVPQLRPELTNVKLCKPEYEANVCQPTAPFPNVQNNLAHSCNIPTMQNHIPGMQSQVVHVPIELSQMQIPISMTQEQISTMHPQIPVMQSHVHAKRTETPIIQRQISTTPTHASIGQATFSIRQDTDPHIHLQNIQLQNHVAHVQQAPVLENPIILEHIPLNQVYSNGELKMGDKPCNRVEIPKHLVELNNHNNEHIPYIVQNKGQCNVDSCLVKSLDPNCNSSYNKMVNCIGDLKKRQYIDNLPTILINKHSDTINGTNANNVKHIKCLEEAKTIETGIPFLKSEQVHLTWLNGYVDTQAPNIQNEASSVSYLNVYSNNASKSVNCNIINTLAGISKDHSNHDLGKGDSFQLHNSQQVVNKKSTNQVDLAQLIKTSNDNLINLQNKQLLDILQTKSDDKAKKSNKIVGTRHNGNNELPIVAANNVSGKNYHNLSDSTSKISYVNLVDTSQIFSSKTNDTNLSSIPHEISSKNELVQNNGQLADHLN
ncbi:conserved Plasmodium protein, unknown function [Plasmodium ovale]|uniref:Uncharacterized protein n=2 Tax=Plasmodium ovale TaxID=36330 RepID=A0A1A8WUQ0_PLAOA|nr:conserved Plasmodium protein, unknown function [Plasmodium ovale curtisi]SBS96686.1 conserved Plasmodium protein, unknown function [Plasmodium ovale curtisi]SCP05566.1 conserved Plasmodium protein, unknown function [Plasmodium ovale]